jgi:ubiquinone/menaquinone biosynthesis C-methylase UbiE
MDHIYCLMGSSEKGERILDASCGTGDFGSFLLIHEAYQPRNTHKVDAKPPHYVGIHSVSSVLAQARYNLGKLAAEIRGLIAPTGIPQPPLIRASFSLVDLNRPLPFRDNQFDRIVCNLVIGYLQEPLFSLRELMRILSPNGKLVVTSLKPQTELSEIYQGLMMTTERSEGIEEAKRLLSNSGKVTQGESQQIFHFFDRQELAMLLTSSGSVRPRIYSTFANQAYIAVAEKPAF